MSAPFDRLPPWDEEAEQALLGAALTSPASVLPEVQPLVEPADFFKASAGHAFAAALAIWERGEGVNVVTVAHEMESRGQLEEAGGYEFLRDCMARWPGAGAQWYAEIVRRDATYRTLLQVFAAAMQRAYEAPAEIGDVLRGVEDRLFEVRSRLGRGTADTSAAALVSDDSYLRGLEDFMANPRALRGTSTGWRRLDSLLDGLAPGRLITIGAGTSIGKSLFSQNLTRYLGRHGVATLTFPTEMRARDHAERMTWMEAGIDRYEVRRRGAATEEEREAVAAAAVSGVATWPVYYVEGHPTLATVRSEVRRHKALYGIGGFFVDHLGFIRAKGENEIAQIRAKTQALKELTVSEGVWCVLTSHVNRASQGSHSMTDAVAGPVEYGDWLSLRDLYGSSGIEQDADQVVLLTPVFWQRGEWLPATRKRISADGGVRFVLADVAKNRWGELGSMPYEVQWAGAGGRLVEMRGEPLS